MQGANILLFITNKISRTDSKFLICFSPSKISALNYPARILLPANLFQFPVQNRPHNIVRSFLWRFLSDSSIIEGTHPHTRSPLFQGRQRKWIGSLRFVYGAFPSFSTSLDKYQSSDGGRALGSHPGLVSRCLYSRPARRGGGAAVAQRGDLGGAGNPACPKIAPAPRLPGSGTASIKLCFT